MSRTYTYQQIESAVAISGDLHGHSGFDAFIVQHDQFSGGSERWRLCIDAALELEKVALEVGVVWGDTHDFYMAIEFLVEEIIHQPELNIPFAIESALNRALH